MRTTLFLTILAISSFCTNVIAQAQDVSQPAKNYFISDVSVMTGKVNLWKKEIFRPHTLHYADERCIRRFKNITDTKTISE